MRIPIAGMDPSLRHWGICRGSLDLVTGELHDLQLTLIEPKKQTRKTVRKNSQDIVSAQELYTQAMKAVSGCLLVFVEVPVGSQSARSMASYGICIGVLAALQASGAQLIQLTPLEVKKALTGSESASKADMIQQATSLYPEADWPRSKGKYLNKTEHLADALGTIYAGVQTQEFHQFKATYETIKGL